MNNDDAALATADKIFTNIVARVSYVVIWGCLLMRVVSLAICVSQFTPKSNGIESCAKREKNKGEKKSLHVVVVVVVATRANTTRLIVIVLQWCFGSSLF